MKLINFFILTAIAASAVACRQEGDVKSADVTPQEELRGDPLILTDIGNMPAHERESVIEKRKANLALGKYIVLDNRQYRITIGKAQAMDMGIRDSIFDAIVAEIDDLNARIAEHDAQGDTLALPDIAAGAEEAVNKGYNI